MERAAKRWRRKMRKIKRRVLEAQQKASIKWTIFWSEPKTLERIWMWEMMWQSPIFRFAIIVSFVWILWS